MRGDRASSGASITTYVRYVRQHDALHDVDRQQAAYLRQKHDNLAA